MWHAFPDTSPRGSTSTKVNRAPEYAPPDPRPENQPWQLSSDHPGGGTFFVVLFWLGARGRGAREDGTGRPSQIRANTHPEHSPGDRLLTSTTPRTAEGGADGPGGTETRATESWALRTPSLAPRCLSPHLHNHSLNDTRAHHKPRGSGRRGYTHRTSSGRCDGTLPDKKVVTSQGETH